MSLVKWDECYNKGKHSAYSLYDYRSKSKYALDINEIYLKKAFIITAIIVKGSKITIEPDTDFVYFIDDQLVPWLKEQYAAGVRKPEDLILRCGISLVKLQALMETRIYKGVMKTASPAIRKYLNLFLVLEGEKYISSTGYKHRRLITLIKLSLASLNDV